MIRAPAAASISSVWSRVGRGSWTVVFPCAPRPASRIADFTWALATGSVYSIPVSAPPSTTSGRQPSVELDRRAHLRSAARRPAPSGGARATRRRRARSGRPGRRGSRRRGARACRRCRSRAARRARGGRGGRRRWTTSVSTSSSSTWTPSARTTPSVDSVSPERPQCETRVSPSASAPIRRARCEIDLSPGNGDVAVDAGGRLNPHRAPPRRRRRSPGSRAGPAARRASSSPLTSRVSGAALLGRDVVELEVAGCRSARRRTPA